MKLRTCLPLLLAVAAIPATAFAENYVGADAMFMNYDETGLPSSDFNGLQLKFGTETDSGIGFEARLGTALSEAEHNNFTVFVPGWGVVTANGTSNMDMMLGAYLTGNLPVNDTFKVYGMFGITSVELTQEGTVAGFGSFSSSSRGTSLSLGAGVSVSASDSVSVNLEYTSLYDKDDIAIKGLNIGIKSLF